MPHQDDELLEEGILSYTKALDAIREFERQMQDRIRAVADLRINDLAKAMDVKIEDGPKRYISQADGYASIGWKYKLVGKEFYVLWFGRLSDGPKTNERSPQGEVSIWLQLPNAAIREGVPAELGNGNEQNWGKSEGGIYLHVPLQKNDINEALREALNAAFDNAIAAWQRVGGAAQFLADK